MLSHPVEEAKGSLYVPEVVCVNGPTVKLSPAQMETVWLLPIAAG